MLLLALPAGCTDEPDALLISLSAESRIDSYTLMILDSRGREAKLEARNEPVDLENPLRDISLPGQELRLALTFSGPGEYVLHIAGFSQGPVQTYTGRVTVRGSKRIFARLHPLIGGDADRDTFPSAEFCEQLADSGLVCDLVDCDDRNPSVHPGAVEICENGIDENCDGEDRDCVDADGDGVPENLDCDDNDPERFPGNPEGPNQCGGLQDPRCDDGIDQDCDGVDAICRTDDDCDGVSPPYDCDDEDPRIYPGAGELCGNGKDDNCDGEVDEGCVSCDLDGDGYQRYDPEAGCTPEAEDLDCDDLDAGVSPGVTRDCDGQEGHPVCARRGMCDGVDNDCDGLVDEGCHDPACDADRDGYMRDDPPSGCNPPPGMADCDDDDPSFYPGAPDLCGDGLIQNCNIDTACTDDADGDGYNASGGDCDDSDPTVHPGAAEICDGKDNDCDGLVDEGNPDGITGERIPEDAYCNLSNVGICGDPAGAGRCVCSRVLPQGATRPSDRQDCTAYGLDLSAAAPRCFFAPVPEMERCDATDWNCDGAPDSPTGDPLLVELDQPCGPSEGECEPGRVTGCDMSRSQEGAFSPHFVCSPDFKPPASEEICNGLDDDCDGIIPDNELDEDGDRYLPCSGCTPGLMAPGLHGCNDCAPSDPLRHPGAAERCNDLDDDCDGTTSDDGEDDCGTTTCCAGIGCRDTLNDPDHCGGCGAACPRHEANQCTAGQCTCNGGAVCTPGQVCDSGGCGCDVDWTCGGCCWHDSCVRLYDQNDDRCGSGGSLCVACPSGENCSWGSCQ